MTRQQAYMVESRGIEKEERKTALETEYLQQSPNVSYDVCY